MCNRRGDEADGLVPVEVWAYVGGFIPSIVKEKLRQIKQRPLQVLSADLSVLP